MALLGIDIGTFETKGVLVERDGSTIGQAARSHGISTPSAGHVEQDPITDWWADLIGIANELTATHSEVPIDAVGVSAIGPCVVAVGKDLAPLRPAILYGVDARATQQIERINAELGPEAIFERCGNYLTSQSAGPKIAWLRDEEPTVWQNARWFMTSQSWLIAQLTGEVVMDHGTAGYYHPVYNLANRTWDVSGCEWFIDEARLPRIDWSTAIAGHVVPEAAAITGIPVGTPVTVGTTDAPAEAVAAGVFEDGGVMAMYGSSGYFIRVGAQPTASPDLWTAPFVFPDTYVLAAGTATAGTATRWICDLLSLTDPDDDTTFGRLLELAEASPPGGRGVLLLPHFSGERTPFQDPDSRGAFVGLGLEHTPADLARATLEGIGHAIAEALLTYRRAGASIDRIVAIGGATKNHIIIDAVSTILDQTQELADSPGASYGDACVAAVGLGIIEYPAGLPAWAPETTPAAPVEEQSDQLRIDHEQWVELYHHLAEFNRSRRMTVVGR